jgi:ectoine hydroxylase-related dioxygenase (phytanoyl-CoA dioxygenase family)
MLTRQQIDSYHENGYLGVEGVLSADEVADLRRVTDEFVQLSAGVTEHTDVFDLEPGHTPDSPKLRRLKDPVLQHDVYRQCLSHPGILDIAEQLVGPGVRTNGNKLNMKSPEYGSPVEWHQDWAFYPHTNDDLLAVGVMLDDMDLENGPILMLPETHRGPVYSHHAKGKFSGAIDLDTCDLDFSKVETVTGRAGSISVHHVRLVHGSSANRSGKPRRLLLWEYAAADAWPLMGAGDLEEFNERVVRGGPTLTPRLEDVPVRIPLPPALHPGSIFENQRAAAHRFFDEADTRQAAYS